MKMVTMKDNVQLTNYRDGELKCQRTEKSLD